MAEIVNFIINLFIEAFVSIFDQVIIVQPIENFIIISLIVFASYSDALKL